MEELVDIFREILSPKGQLWTWLIGIGTICLNMHGESIDITFY